MPYRLIIKYRRHLQGRQTEFLMPDGLRSPMAKLQTDRTLTCNATCKRMGGPKRGFATKSIIILTHAPSGYLWETTRGLTVLSFLTPR
jgi:hypothetical protein